MSVLKWPELVIEELLRCGLDTFFVAPGSRSTPLVSAIARHPDTKTIVHFDERGSAFAALGFGRVTGRPAVWVTTSGTAVANGMPAVVEASMDNVPILLLTADRPAELRDTGANQTIIQPDIFGRYTRWSFDIPVEETHVDPAFVLTTMDHAVYRAISQSGPVHINCMFRKPLELQPTHTKDRTAPTDPESTASTQDSHLAKWDADTQPYTQYAPATVSYSNDGSTDDLVHSAIAKASRPVVLLGRSSSGDFVSKNHDAIAEWASSKGIPVFPDVASGFRLKDGSEAIIHFWELACTESFQEPDLILQFGRGMISTRWDMTSAIKIVVDDGYQRFDPGHRVDHRLTVGLESVQSLLGLFDSIEPKEATWLGAWRRRDDIVEGALKSEMDSMADGLTEEAVAHVLPGLLPDNALLVLGNSMCVRNVDRWGGVSAGQITTLLSRGTSGIDGTIAQAAGASAAAHRPTIVLLGDQALLHDLNSLALAKKERLLIVVINNDGGRIFHRLPISKQEDVFEKFFVGPQGFTFEHAAAQFGMEHHVATSLVQMEEVAQRYSTERQATIIEVPIDFGRNEEHRHELEGIISEALKS